MAYAQIPDLFRYGMPEHARVELADDVLQAGIEAASAEADGYLRGRYAMPITAWDDQLTMYVCWIATYLILTTRGFSAEAGADSNIRQRYEDARMWFEGVQRKAIHPAITAGAAQSPTYDQPVVLTSSVVSVASGRIGLTRGW